MIYKKLLMILTALASIIYSGYPEEDDDYDQISPQDHRYDPFLNSKPRTREPIEHSFLNCPVALEFIYSDPDLRDINSEISLYIATEKGILEEILKEIGDNDEKMTDVSIIKSLKLSEFLRNKFLEMFEFLEKTGEHLDFENINLMLESFDAELKKEEEKQSNIILESKEKWTSDCKVLYQTIVDKCHVIKILIGKYLSKKIKKINPDLQRQVQSRIDQLFPIIDYDADTYSKAPIPQKSLSDSGSTRVLTSEVREASSTPATPTLGGGDLSRESTPYSLQRYQEMLL